MYYRDKNGGIKKIVGAVIVLIIVVGIAAGVICIRYYTTVKTTIQEADSLAEQEAYEEAIKIIEDALKKYERSKSLLSAKEQYESDLRIKIKEETIEQAASYAQKKEYEMAMAVITEAQDTYGDDTDYQNLYFEYYKADVLTKSEAYSSEENYIDAIRILKEANEKYSNDLDFVAQYNSYSQKYVESVLKHVDLLLNDYRINDAIEIVEEAKKAVPENEKLAQRLDELKKAKPIVITDLPDMNASKWKWNEGTPVDPFGNDYSSMTNYVIFHNQSSDKRQIEYRVDGKYKKITGIVAPHKDIGEKITGIVSIYADDSLVYTSSTVMQKTDAVTFAADIEGAKYIKIEVRFNATNPWDVFVDRLILADIQLWPDLTDK